MKRIVIAAVGLMALAGPAWQVKAQLAPPLGTAMVASRSPEQLEQLLGPVALYPDPLIAEVLPAATQPSQVVMASRYVQQGVSLEVIDQQPWDPTVKALARHPELLRWMDNNLPWTTEVGQAYIYQNAAVLNAIQRLRQQAVALGHLQSTPQQTVYRYENGIIAVVPANPQLIHVPVYQPAVVYKQPAPRTGVHISFGLGVIIGRWLHHDLDWRERRVVEWRRDNPRPHNWWHHQAQDHRKVTVVNNTKVIHNRVEHHNRPNWPTHRSPAPVPVVRQQRIESQTVYKPQSTAPSRPSRPGQQEPRWSHRNREQDHRGGSPWAGVHHSGPVVNKGTSTPQQTVPHPTASKGNREHKAGRFS